MATDVIPATALSGDEQNHPTPGELNDTEVNAPDLHANTVTCAARSVSSIQSVCMGG